MKCTITVSKRFGWYECNYIPITIFKWSWKVSFAINPFSLKYLILIAVLFLYVLGVLDKTNRTVASCVGRRRMYDKSHGGENVCQIDELLRTINNSLRM